MTKGSAYMRFTCPSVRALDFGTDLYGGSTVLAETKPWKRTPRWRGRAEGPPSSYDVALHLDFDDQAGIDDYNKDDVHHEVAVYNAAVCQGEYTARIDWWYDGAPLITTGRGSPCGDVHLGRRRGRDNEGPGVGRRASARRSARCRARDDRHQRRNAPDGLRLDPRRGVARSRHDRRRSSRAMRTLPRCGRSRT